MPLFRGRCSTNCQKNSPEFMRDFCTVYWNEFYLDISKETKIDRLTWLRFKLVYYCCILFHKKCPLKTHFNTLCHFQEKMSNKIARKFLLNSWGSFKTNKQFLQSYQIQRNRFPMTLKLSWKSNMKLWKNPENTYCSPQKLPNSFSLAPIILE